MVDWEVKEERKNKEKNNECSYPHFTNRYCLSMKWEVEIELYSSCIGVNRRNKINISILGRWDDEI